MTLTHKAPSLFDDGQVGRIETALPASSTQVSSLIDLLYEGFYIVFLLKDQYVPSDADKFREKMIQLLNDFEFQAKKLNFSAVDIKDAKYGFCALIDEAISTQKNDQLLQLQNIWSINPLQLTLFGSQLAGYQFFEKLEILRANGKERLAALEVFHYCLLLGFEGKYRIESNHLLNHLTSRVGDEIDFLKGNKAEFSPFAALPDQIRHVIHRELPFVWILLFLLFFSVIAFFSLYFTLHQHNKTSLSNYENVIQAVVTEQAHITIHLP